MLTYIVRRIVLMVPTLLGIMVVNFFIIQAAPGGPVEQMISEMQGRAVSATARITGAGAGDAEVARTGGGGPGAGLTTSRNDIPSKYRGSRGMPPELIKEIEKQYGFDKPIGERFILTMKDLMVFNFGRSYYRDATVIDLIWEKLPVSLSLGVWATLLTYLISIPLGIAKALRDGSKFDAATSVIILVGNAIPSYLFAVLLIVLFAGGSFWHVFPLRGLVSPDWDQLSLGMKVLDYAWHMVLPLVAMLIGGFATLTVFTKNLFIEEISKQYVITARAKGLTERRVLYSHVFRNAMLIVIAGFPAAFLSVFFAGSMLIEIIFSLDGLGRMGYEATLNRDYPLVFGSLYMFTIIGLVMGLVRDLMFAWIDPRIHFERVEVA